MSDKLRVALVGGPMYDALYEPFIDEVEVIVHADHLTLNTRVAELLAAGERIDVLSTHAKYAPSQRQWLRPLDDLIDPNTVAALEPGAVALCRGQENLLCVPRNVDVRTLWWRTDRMDGAPNTFRALVRSDTVFGFTGRGSGLFGLFYELVVGAGGELFDEHNTPALATRHAEEALETIRTLGDRCPAGADGITSWHYDEVDDMLSGGVVDCAAVWPGATTALRDSPLGDRLRPAPYPAGPIRRVSYSGCHGWAIPATCGDLTGAVALVDRLCSAEVHRIEASLGGIPARTDTLEAIMPRDSIDAERLDVIRRTIADAMITYPALERFPRLEDTGAAAITGVLMGEATVVGAVEVIQRELAGVRRGTTRSPG